MAQRNFEFLFFGLASAWGIVALYLIVLAQRNRRIQRELDRVKRMVNDRG